MTEVSCCKKGLVYTFLGLNIFLSFVINLLLYLATYDVIFLDWYQYMYLVFAVIIWLLLFCTYVAKLVLILIGKLPSKFIILITWMVLNIPAIIFFIIAFIFDLVMYDQNEISWSIYIIAFVLIFILFLVFTGFDFFLIKIQYQMGENNKNKKSENNGSIPVKSSQTIELNEMREAKEAKEVKVIQNQENNKKFDFQNEKIKEN